MFILLEDLWMCFCELSFCKRHPWGRCEPFPNNSFNEVHKYLVSVTIVPVRIYRYVWIISLQSSKIVFRAWILPKAIQSTQFPKYQRLSFLANTLGMGINLAWDHCLLAPFCIGHGSVEEFDSLPSYWYYTLKSPHGNWYSFLSGCASEYFLNWVAV